MDIKIFELASKVSTPLGLAGIFAVIVFFILKQIVESQKKQGQKPNTLYVKIIDKLFILALVAMSFGFLGWVITKVYKPSPIGPRERELNFNVYIEKKPIEGIKVTIVNIFPNPPSKTSTRDGQISMVFDTAKQNKELRLVFKNENLNINEDRTVLLDTFPPSFDLTPIKKQAVAKSKNTDETKDKIIKEPILKEITFQTTSKNFKDAKTGLKISVMTSNTLQEFSNNIYSSKINEVQFDSNSVHSLSLPINIPLRKQDCNSFRVKLILDAPRRDRWIFDALITLKFSDNSTMTARQNNVFLEYSGDIKEFSSQ